MSYTYYTTMRPFDPGCTPAPAGNEPIVVANYDSMKTTERCGKPAWGQVTYAEPLDPDFIVAYELTAGALPSQRAILEALDCGMIYPAVRDGLLCICINEDAAADIKADELSFPGDLTVSKFWKGGMGTACRLVQTMLSTYLADDELAERVIEFIRALGGREPRASVILRQARMAEAADSPELAELCA